MRSSVHAMQQRDTRERHRASNARIHALCVCTRTYPHASHRRALADLILRFVTPLIPHLAFTAIHQGADAGGINSVTWKPRKIRDTRYIPEGNLFYWLIVASYRNCCRIVILNIKKASLQNPYIYIYIYIF